MTTSISNSAISKTEILLEAGTNEVEIFEFKIGDQHYGVNVAKVNQIIQRDQLKITRADLPPNGVLGTIPFRGKPVMTLDLAQILHIDSSNADPSRSLMLVTQFNDQVVAFAIDGAERIHRVSWKNFEPINSGFSEENPFVNGIIRIDEKLILVLDLEYILTLVNPRLGMTVDQTQLQRIEEKYKPRDHIKILFAEDSAMIRRMVESQLREVGFSNLQVASNGKEALNQMHQYIEQSQESGKPLNEFVDLVLTDIEMPVMDGLTLCRTIKKDLNADVPVIVFSSLINDQMIIKCKSVGANGWGSKPQVDLIVDIIDRLIVKGETEIGDLLAAR
ncbi:chemotaxis protein [Puniceicoccaceae bacterium K14]|nr:chemotaxis protein [Puniceicoccaceae bacterium K14]